MDVTDFSELPNGRAFSQPIVPGMFGLNTPLANPDTDRELLNQHPFPAKVLFVDDHSETVAVMSLLLNSLSYEAVCAHSAAEAIEKTSAESFDVVISDISLPDMDGFSLLKQIRKQRPVPGIAVTGYEPAAVRRRCAEAGFVEVIRKPLDIVLLHIAIQKIMRDRSGHALITLDVPGVVKP